MNSLRLPTLFATVASASALVLAGCSGAVSAQPDGIYAIDSCDTVSHARAESDAYPILANGVYRLGGWSHAGFTQGYATLDQAPVEYKISAANYLADDSCVDYKTLDVTLVKRILDWDKQHVNGIETKFPSEGITFDTATDIVLELRIRPEDTSIPTEGELADALGGLLSDEQLAALDGQQINLELTLMGEASNGDHPFLNAGTIISIDPDEFADGWIRVQIPVSELDFYTEANYVRTPVALADYPGLIVEGLRINPETSEGNTARHFLLDDFVPGAQPEIFKEMGLTFALIEIGHLRKDDA